MSLNPNQVAQVQSLLNQIIKGGPRYHTDKIRAQADDLLKRFEEENKQKQAIKEKLKAKHLKRFARGAA